MDSFYGDLGNDDTPEGDISDVDISEVENVLGAVGGFGKNLFSSLPKSTSELSSQTKGDASPVKTSQKVSEGSTIKIVKPLTASESSKELSFSNKKLFSADFDDADPLGDLLSDEESSQPKKTTGKHGDSTFGTHKSEDKAVKKNDKSGIMSKLFGLDKKVVKPSDSVTASVEKSPSKKINLNAGNKHVYSADTSSSIETDVSKNKAQNIYNVQSVKDSKLTSDSSMLSNTYGTQLDKENKISKPISDSSLIIHQSASVNNRVLPDDNSDINDLLEDNSKEVLSKALKDSRSAQMWNTEKQKSSVSASSYVPSATTTRESRRSGIKKDTSNIFDPLGIIATVQPSVDRNNENALVNKRVETSILESSVVVDSPPKLMDSDNSKLGQSADIHSSTLLGQSSRNISKSDWLGISDTDILDDSMIVKSSSLHSSRRALVIADNQSKITPSAVISPSQSVTSPDKLHHSKIKINSENAVHLPEWLGGKPESSPVKKKIPVEKVQTISAPANVDVKNSSESVNDVERASSSFTDVLRDGERFDQAVMSFLQHQDFELLLALHLKQREKEMANQQDTLLRQESLLKQLIDKKLSIQKVKEEKFKEQQDRINHHLQALMSQSEEQPLSRSSISVPIITQDSDTKQVEDQMNVRYEEEMQTMKSSFAHQISLLQEALERQEKRLKHEISQLEMEHQAKLLKMQEERKLLEEEHQKKMKSLQEEKLLDIQNIKKFYHQELESLRSYYMKTVEDIHKSSMQNRYMTMLNEKLDESSQQLSQLQEKIQKSSENYYGLKDTLSKSKDLEVQALNQKLDNQSKLYKQMHQDLVKLISQIEGRMMKQQSEIEAKHLKLSQETLKFESRVHDFELEKQKIQNRKEELQNVPEKISQNIPSGNKKTEHNRNVSQTSAHCGAHPGVDKIRKEAEAAIQTANQAFQQVRAEKERLTEEQKRTIQEQRRLQELERRLTTKAQELDILTQVAVSTKQQGLHALEEAKYIELKHNIQVTDIHRQLSELKEREIKLGKDKAELMHEKDVVEKMKKTRYCELCKTLLKHQQQSSVSLTANKTTNIIDPEYIILKYSAEKDIEQSLIQSILPSR